MRCETALGCRSASYRLRQEAGGVTDDGLAPVRGVGTGHADGRNSPRVTQGSPRHHYPPVWCPRAPTRPVMGRAGGPPGSRPRPACLLGERDGNVLAGPAGQVQMDPFWPSDRTRLKAAAARAAGAGDLARAASSRLRRHRHIRHRQRPHCQPTRRRLRPSLPHQEQVNEFGPTGLQPVPTRPAGRKDQGRPLGTDQRQGQSCDESSRAPAPGWRWRPGRGFSWDQPPVQVPCGT
jgi:hypothetical protein